MPLVHQCGDGHSLIIVNHVSEATREVRTNMFAISIFTTRYKRYIPVRQVAGMRTARYRAVPSKIDRRQSISTVGGRFRP
ncbi:hypothetical protein B296_00055962 [Ensete ventricosum]|uniref:Uncharacterized protein n=1 Tax=Ensete ventricosum TaxID=4639 RepID=A0A426XUQ6_ENSVE|nr:hypothetical protein B296_00055962 [Ensete ventricosum]